MAERDEGGLLTVREVAELLRVTPKTVTRWADARRLTTVRTLGGHRRYLASEITALLEATWQSRDEEEDS